jgi:DNA polymerase III epsilon subunit-like protein
MLKLTRPLAVYDLETTGVNPATDRIVEISILKVFPDGTREMKTRRLNPERDIPYWATTVHGIRAADVAEQPNFRQLAKGLWAYLADCDLCTFNGKRFDVPLLANEFARVALPFPAQEVEHVDVYELFKALHPEASSKSLSAAVTHYLGREHTGAHAADADTAATLAILEAMMVGPLTAHLAQESEMTAEELFCPKGLGAFAARYQAGQRSQATGKQPHRLFQNNQNASQAIDQLVGLCTGILADGEVSEQEAVFFADWVRKHAPAEPVWPFTDVLNRLERIFADGVCDAEERAELKEVMQALCTGTHLPASEAEPVKSTLPLCEPAPHPLTFAGQQFVVTGKFAYGARSAVFAAISALGGQPTDSAPTRATRYVVIGAFGSQDWASGSQGRKIEKAVQLRNQGVGLHIVSKEHWSQFLQ